MVGGVPVTTSQQQIDQLLQQLRDTPVDNDGLSDDMLGTLYTYLMQSTPKTRLIPFHWFCREANPTTVGAATFLLRLLAYNNALVDEWKEKFNACLSMCPKCVLALERAKLESMNTYLAAFREDIRQSFMATFVEWELECVIKACGTSLPSVSAVVYRIVSNLSLLQDKAIYALFTTNPPTTKFSDWPKDPIAPGLFLLLMHENQQVRSWAEQQIKLATTPISNEQFLNQHKLATEIATHVLATKTPDSRFPFTTDSLIVWSAYFKILTSLPENQLCAAAFDIRRLVVNHLEDTGSEFVAILRCFLILLKRIGSKLWENEDADYPEQAFDRIKDNRAYLELIKKDGAGSQSWSLLWFSTYLKTIPDRKVYLEVLAKMANFLFEELQHQRFAETRPIALLQGAKILSSRWNSTEDRETIIHIMDVHANSWAVAAYASSHKDPAWQTARVAIRDLIALIQTTDITNISQTLSDLHIATFKMKTSSSSSYDVGSLQVGKQFWRKSYDSLQVDDTDAAARILNTVSQAAHLDTIYAKSFKLQSSSAPTSESKAVRSAIENTVDEFNRALGVIADGFFDAINAFADRNTASTMRDFLRLPDVPKSLIKLMLSPVDAFHDGAKALVTATFDDADLREECFRALFVNLPDPSFDGLFAFLATFISHASLVVEACSLCKHLVPCLTDVFKVFCGRHDGLLLSGTFLRVKDEKGPASRLLDLWSLMTKALTIIFKRTPSWSTYFQTSEMVVWMRDVLLFGEDILEQRSVVETAVTRFQSSSKQGKEASEGVPIAKTMVLALEETLMAITGWLRLTNDDLLHLSFSLLQKLLDCFHDSKLSPPKAAMDKLSRQITDAQNKKVEKTRLDEGRVAILASILQSFNEDNDEDEIIILDGPPEKSPPTKPSTKMQKDNQSKLPVARPSLPRPVPAFTDRDKQKLEQDRPVVSAFRRSSNVAPHPEASSSRRAPSAAASEKSDSSQSSSDEDESQPVSLASLAKTQRSPKIKKPVERRQIQIINIPTAKNPMEERIKQREAARRVALRLKPDITGLHRILLSWDYEQTGDLPPGLNGPFRAVPGTFRDYSHYREVFYPLLLLEAWQHLQQSKDEPGESVECMIVSRSWADEWLPIEITIALPVPKNWYLAETDVVLLRLPDGSKRTLAKVDTYRQSPTGIQATVRTYFPTGHEPGLKIQSTWLLTKVFSLSTLHREYAALTALDYYDYRDAILKPALPKPSPPDQSKLNRIMTKHQVNQPQAVAICHALESEGFVLIQGPPGTGKTSTICGLISAFLSSRTVNIVPGKSGTDPTTAPKVLLCAPSNAAIDEIAARLKNQLQSPDRARVVRVGADSALSTAVKEISLDFLVDQILEPREASAKETQQQLAAQRGELESVKKDIDKVSGEMKTITDNTSRIAALEKDLLRLKERRGQISKQIQRLIEERTSDSRALDAGRRKARLDILQSADVICGTLSGAGHEILEQLDFDMVVIDEAAQAIELSSLIPFRYSWKRCVMVGDPKQLPPTVLSSKACSYNYNQSLFVRLQRQRPEAIHLLSIQYRMHPEISLLPSRLFYDGRLQDGPDMASKTLQPWHTHSIFGTYKFFDVKNGLEEKSGRSLKNTRECEVALALYHRLSTEFRSTEFTIGVVSMYRSQVAELRRVFGQRYGRDIFHSVSFNTVDGFQGQEKDVIILSCVRAGPSSTNVGFLADTRRMNVAITRAKSSLFVLGNAATLERSDDTWKQIVNDARERGKLVLGTTPSLFTEPVRETQAPPQTPPRSSPRKPKHRPQTPTRAPPPSDLVAPKQFKNRIKPTKSSDEMQDVEMTGPSQLSPNSLKRKRSMDNREGSSSHRPPPVVMRPKNKNKDIDNILFHKKKRKH